MSTVPTHEGVEILYKDWGPKNAQPIVQTRNSPSL